MSVLLPLRNAVFQGSLLGDEHGVTFVQMGLTKCAGTQVGKPGMKKGISGGESKRLSVGCEVSIT